MAVIRLVEDRELETCAAVIRESFLTVAEPFGITPETAPTNPAFMSVERLRAEAGRADLYGLFDEDGRQLGAVALEEKDDGVWYMERLAVLPAARHRGLGRMLLDFAARTVREAGGTCISIGIIEENTRLRDWYVACGFVHTGIKRFDHLPFTVGFLELRL